MKKAFGAILIAVILIVCVVTLTVQRGENAMLEFPERPAEGCTVMSLEITDGKAQTEVIGTSRPPFLRRWSPWRGDWRSLLHPPAPPWHRP